MHTHSAPFSSLLVLLAITSTANAASLYPKSSSVLNIDSKTYDSLIAKSNYTSIVEFYAPWCGHCQNLKPQYEKAATSLAGLAKVAAINCDDDGNKAFCGGMGIQGFPTLKIVKPPKKKGGKALVEDYQGQRTAKGIKDIVLEKIPNHVTRVKDDELEQWLQRSSPKALFFSEKGLISPLAKALAIDFLGALDIGYTRNGDKETVKKFGVTTFPTVMLLPTDGEPIKYDGEIKKAPLVKFLSQAASPNPDATGATSSSPSSKEKKESIRSTAKGAQATVESSRIPQASESPDPKVGTDPEATPIEVPVQSAPSASPKPRPHHLDTEDQLTKACLNSKSSTCVLALLPSAAGVASDPPTDDGGNEAASGPGKQASNELLDVLGEIDSKFKRSRTKIFPFYSVSGNPRAVSSLVDALSLNKEVLASSPIVIAVNSKKGWYVNYGGDTGSLKALGDWIDAIRLGDVTKERLPEGLVKEAEKEAEREGEREAERQADEDALKVEFMQELSDEDVERLMAKGKMDGEGHDEL